VYSRNCRCRRILDVGEHMQTATSYADPAFGADLRRSPFASSNSLALTSHESSLGGMRQSFTRAACKGASGLMAHEWAHEWQAAQ
jgi:hypothetical protein